ncbi:MAG: acyl carrier protein [Planctomycetota bacterium]|jgi:acyl carrier protein
MNRSEIIEQLRDILEPWVSDVDLIDEIGEDTDLVSDLGLDSIGILQVILGIEKTLGISIENHELDAEILSMTGNLVSLIQKKLDEDN